MSDKKKKMRYNPSEKGYKSVRFEIRLSEETFKKLEKLSESRNQTKSEVIRTLIEKAK